MTLVAVVPSPSPPSFVPERGGRRGCPERTGEDVGDPEGGNRVEVPERVAAAITTIGASEDQRDGA